MKYSILMGLPGSGKSTWADMYRDKNSVKRWYGSVPQVAILHCDEFFEYERHQRIYGNFEDFIYGEVMDLNRSDREEIIIDGLFTTNEDICKVITSLDNLLRQGDSITIHYWGIDKEQCKINDLYRRKESSKSNIDSLPYDESPDIKLIREHISNTHPDIKAINLYTELHTVYEKPIWFILADKYNISYDLEKATFKSNEWVIGGRWGNCWGDEGPVSAEEPEEFTQFDELIEKICPEISFLKYKAVRSACVSLEERCESGYYGGYTDYNFYECNLEYLYKILEELNMISEEDILNEN